MFEYINKALVCIYIHMHIEKVDSWYGVLEISVAYGSNINDKLPSRS